MTYDIFGRRSIFSSSASNDQQSSDSIDTIPSSGSNDSDASLTTLPRNGRFADRQDSYPFMYCANNTLIPGVTSKHLSDEKFLASLDGMIPDIGLSTQTDDPTHF
ncbi:hypothetical protein J4457_05535 [Candidatus Woesearchaeota archaeon]|nr:hypothetical protein [Candidatus Woesearchaeota archaeon]